MIGKRRSRYLEEEWSKEKGRLIVLYGRRRIGKIRLLLEFIKTKDRNGIFPFLLPFGFEKIGRWWHKGEAIDIVAVNDKRKQIVFF